MTEGARVSETRNDAVQIVREALRAWYPGDIELPYDVRAALDRIEAVVNAAREMVAPELDEARADLAEARQELALEQAQREDFQGALATISGPSDSGPWVEAYRAAGGGYEGLQAIADAVLDKWAVGP